MFKREAGVFFLLYLHAIDDEFSAKFIINIFWHFWLKPEHEKYSKSFRLYSGLSCMFGLLMP